VEPKTFAPVARRRFKQLRAHAAGSTGNGTTRRRHPRRGSSKNVGDSTSTDAGPASTRMTVDRPACAPGHDDVVRAEQSPASTRTTPERSMPSVGTRAHVQDARGLSQRRGEQPAAERLVG